MLKYNYTLEDLCMGIPPASVDNADRDHIVSILKKGISGIPNEFTSILFLYGMNINELYGMKYEGGGYVINSTPYSKLINLIRLRYGDHYCVSSENTIDFNILYSNKDLKEFCRKFTAILVATKDKYVNILNIYDNNISKLMNGLKNQTDSAHTIHKDEDYDTDVTGKNLYNDTPQTTDVVATMEGDQYVTELSKSTAHTDNTGDIDETGERHDIIVSDTKYAMEKIKDIQDSFEKVLYRWSEEFHGLFIEEEMVL